jgi:cyclopropane fatty-acyl-phospholipid synthase-like methyltransferase
VLDFADIVIRMADLPEGAHLADIGGGIGRVTQAVLERRPDLTLSLVELPSTAARAAARLAQEAGGSRIAVVPYNGQRRLEPPADRCLLSRVIATLGDSAAVDLLGFAARSLTDGGRVEIIDFEADGTPAAGLSDLLHLARSGGAVRSRSQWQELAHQAGLRIGRRRAIEGPYVYLSLELDPEATRAASEHAGVATGP